MIKDLAIGLVLLVSILLITERDASAYTDPGTGALLWQMMLAVAFGLLFYVRRVLDWLKLRHKSQDKNHNQPGTHDPIE